MVSDKRGMAQRCAISIGYENEDKYLCSPRILTQSIRYWADVLRLLCHLKDLEHSISDDIAHDLVAFGREMQSVIPELFT